MGQSPDEPKMCTATILDGACVVPYSLAVHIVTLAGEVDGTEHRIIIAKTGANLVMLREAVRAMGG